MAAFCLPPAMSAPQVLSGKELLETARANAPPRARELAPRWLRIFKHAIDRQIKDAPSMMFEGGCHIVIDDRNLYTRSGEFTDEERAEAFSLFRSMLLFREEEWYPGVDWWVDRAGDTFVLLRFRVKFA